MKFDGEKRKLCKWNGIFISHVNDETVCRLARRWERINGQRKHEKDERKIHENSLEMAMSWVGNLVQLIHLISFLLIHFRYNISFHFIFFFANSLSFAFSFVLVFACCFISEKKRENNIWLWRNIFAFCFPFIECFICLFDESFSAFSIYFSWNIQIWNKKTGYYEWEGRIKRIFSLHRISCFYHFSIWKKGRRNDESLEETVMPRERGPSIECVLNDFRLNSFWLLILHSVVWLLTTSMFIWKCVRWC